MKSHQRLQERLKILHTPFHKHESFVLTVYGLSIANIPQKRMSFMFWVFCLNTESPSLITPGWQRTGKSFFKVTLSNLLAKGVLMMAVQFRTKDGTV